VSQICAQHGKTIFDDPDFNATILEIGEFGLDLLREVREYQSTRAEEEFAEKTISYRMSWINLKTLELKQRVDSLGKILRGVAKGFEMIESLKACFVFGGGRYFNLLCSFHNIINCATYLYDSELSR
jgi:hypothetical protein